MASAFAQEQSLRAGRWWRGSTLPRGEQAVGGVAALADALGVAVEMSRKKDAQRVVEHPGTARRTGIGWWCSTNVGTPMTWPG